MSGHSKWATIKRSKGAADAKRGQVFTKMGREIVSAVRDGGPNPETNFRLRLIIDKAKQVNMPKDNIERAIERASGADKSANLEEYTYEGYGPSGTALLVSVLTDNRNRTIAEIRRVFTRGGANLGEAGSVAWMFDHKGYMAIPSKDSDAEEVALKAIDAGAEDVKVSDGYVEVFTQMGDFQAVKEALEGQGVNLESAELSWIPKTTMDLPEEEAIRNLRLIDALEELDDVLNVYSNLNISDELIEKYGQEG